MTRTLLGDLFSQKKRSILFAKVVLDAPRISKDGVNKNRFDILFKHVTDSKGVEVTDHVWVSERDLCPTESLLGLVNYCVIRFVARSEIYGKYKESDFGLTDIGNIKVIGQSNKESGILDFVPLDLPSCQISQCPSLGLVPKSIYG